MPLGMAIGLGPGHIMLHGDPAPPPQKGDGAPNYRLLSVVAKRLHAWVKMPVGMEIGLGPGHIVLDRDPAPPPQKGHI